jgi:hypothetical protein
MSGARKFALPFLVVDVALFAVLDRRLCVLAIGERVLYLQQARRREWSNLCFNCFTPLRPAPRQLKQTRNAGRRVVARVRRITDRVRIATYIRPQ